MTHKGLKLGVAGLIFASAIGYLAFAGAQKGWVYTLSVDHFLASAAEQTQRVRLCGHVAEDELVIAKAQLTAHFKLKGETQSIAVAYRGVVPDMFKAGAEVLVEGKRDGAGVFQADVLMTKCASKYDEAPKGHPEKKAPAQTPAAAPAGGQS